MTHFILFIIVIVAALVWLIAWMRAYDKAHKAKLNARPKRLNSPPKQLSSSTPYPTSHYPTISQSVFDTFDGKPVLLEHVLVSCPEAQSLARSFRVPNRTTHAQDTSRGTAYLFLEERNTYHPSVVYLAVCAPRPVGLAKGFEVHKRTFSWKEPSWDAYYKYKQSDLSGLKYNPSILQSLCPEVHGTWLEKQELFNGWSPKADFFDFHISVWETHIALRCTLSHRMGKESLDFDTKIDLSKRALTHMLELSMSDLWRNDHVQTQEDFIIHLATHIEEQAQSVIAFIVEDVFDYKKVSAHTRDRIAEIARARDLDGNPALLNEIRKRWDARAPDGLTMVEHHDAQGGLTATTPDGGLTTADHDE